MSPAERDALIAMTTEEYCRLHPVNPPGGKLLTAQEIARLAATRSARNFEKHAVFRKEFPLNRLIR